jgi:hypothetical protein
MKSVLAIFEIILLVILILIGSSISWLLYILLPGYGIRYSNSMAELYFVMNEMRKREGEEVTVDNVEMFMEIIRKINHLVWNIIATELTII